MCAAWSVETVCSVSRSDWCFHTHQPNKENCSFSHALLFPLFYHSSFKFIFFPIVSRFYTRCFVWFLDFFSSYIFCPCRFFFLCVYVTLKTLLFFTICMVKCVTFLLHILCITFEMFQNECKLSQRFVHFLSVSCFVHPDAYTHIHERQWLLCFSCSIRLVTVHMCQLVAL